MILELEILLISFHGSCLLVKKKQKHKNIFNNKSCGTSNTGLFKFIRPKDVIKRRFHTSIFNPAS